MAMVQIVHDKENSNCIQIRGFFRIFFLVSTLFIIRKLAFSQSTYELIVEASSAFTFSQPAFESYTLKTVGHNKFESE